MFLRLLFLLIASFAVLAALGAVMARNLVRAALYLVAFFFLVACLFVLLEAEFLAAIQVLVYIGAVAILILFGIMLTRNIQGDETTRSTSSSFLLCGVASLGVLAILIGGIRNDTGLGRQPGWTEVASRPPITGADGVPTTQGVAVNDMARSIGLEMMTRFVIPFELAGLLLTASVVGAIALAMVSRDEPASPETTADPKRPPRSDDNADEPQSPPQAPATEALASSAPRSSTP